MKHHPGHEYMEAIADGLVSSNFHQVDPQLIANVILGFAIMEHLNHRFMESAITAAISNIEEISPQNLVRTLLGLLRPHMPVHILLSPRSLVTAIGMVEMNEQGQLCSCERIGF